MKLKYKNLFFLISIAIFYYIIAHTTILSLDDFRWGTTIGLNRLVRNFDNYNGRYLGNYTIITMTRSYLAQVLLPTVVNTGIIVYIYKILDKKINLPFIMLLVLTLPFEIYRQTYGFMSGFANYNTVVFLLLIIIFLLKKKENSTIELFTLMILGFAVQLFLENVSAVNIVLSTIFLIISLFYKHHIKKAIILFTSISLGTVTMFSNSAYMTNDTSRGLSNVNLKVIPTTFFTVWSELFIKNNVLLLIIFAIAIYLISDKNKYINYLISTVSIYFSIRKHFNLSWNKLPSKIIYIESLLIIIFLTVLLVNVYKSKILTKNMKYNFYLFFLLSGLYSGPFLAISMNNKPFIFPRNVLTTYVLLIISVLYLYKPFLTTEIIDRINFKKVTKLVTISVMLVILSMSIVNNIFNNSQINLAKKEIIAGKTVVEIQELPFEKLFLTWNINESSNFMPQFKEYYEIPEEVEVNQIPLKNKFIKK